MTFENIEDGGILFDKILKVLLKTFPTIYHTFDQKFKSEPKTSILFKPILSQLE